MTSAVTPWDGLGKRVGAPAPVPPATPGDDGEAGSLPVIQRIVPAANAPSAIPAGVVVSPFAHPYRPAGSAARPAADPPAANNEEITNMATKPRPPSGKRKASPHRADSPQHRLARLLLDVKHLTREQLVEAMPDLNTQQLSNATWNARTAGRIENVNTKDGPAWRLTAAGREWISSIHAGVGKGEAPPPKATKRKTPKKPRAAKTPKAAHKKANRRTPAAKAALALVSASPEGAVTVVQERSFRCAVFSDGGFHLAKNGQAIDLTPTEHAELQRYLQRMADLPGA